MLIWFKLNVLSDFSSDIIALNIDFSEKKQFWTNIMSIQTYKTLKSFTEA